MRESSGGHRARRVGRRAGVTAGALLALAACGGGGGDAAAPSNPPPPAPNGPTWTAGTFQPASTFAAKCAAPRTGNDPQTGRPWPDTAGSELTEKHWLRSWTNELYLWFNEVPDRDPASTSGVLAYFDGLKTPALTASGNAKDRFHFTYATTEWRQLSQSGVTGGYGAAWQFLRTTPPRELVVAFTEPGSPAAAAGLGRGARVLAIDGVDLVNDNTTAGINTLNAALSPAGTGRTHQFTVRDRAGTTRTVSLTSASVTIDPVPLARMVNGTVGYLLFNDHIATAERKLVDAVNLLRTGGATELVLDLRYNGGGFLDLASELAYMIGGDRVAGKTFERLQFNSRHPTTNPVTGTPLGPMPFHTTTRGFSLASGQPLPTLNLSRVFVLTSDDTCSASESLINSLNGAGVQVIQVGGNTCGKPYGFYPTDNCGTTYFSIQFQGVNDAGFGDYVDGFSPNRAVGDPRANLPGCARNDDFTHDLGDPAENRLAAALSWVGSGFCAAAPVGAASGPRAAAAASLAEGPAGEALQVPDEPWRRNRLLRAD